MRKVVNALINYVFKAENNEWYANITVNGIEMDVKNNYFNLNKKRGSNTLVVMKAFDKPVEITKPAYEDHKARKLMVVGEITDLTADDKLAMLNIILA